MPPLKKALLLAGWAVIFAGCTVGPVYHKPAPKVPGKFGEIEMRPGARGAGVTGDRAQAATLAAWWKVFHDPELDSLVERALRNNTGLKLAVSRVREARAERQVVASGLLPELDATAGYNRSLGSENVKLPLGSLIGATSPGASGGGAAPMASGHSLRTVQPQDLQGGAPAAVSQPSSPPGGPNSPFGEGGLPGITTNLYQAGFDAVWEVDVFGGVRRAVEAAGAEAAAAREGEYGVRVTLLAEVATTYFEMRSDQSQEEIARRNIQSQRKTWRISKDKVDAGMGDAVEASQELAQLRLDETQLPPLIAAERISQHALAFMLGEDPAALLGELSPRNSFSPVPDSVPVGVPSDLLLRRPDIRQAERELAASSAQVGEATAQLYPQFSLTGSFGVDSSDVKHLPEWSSRYYSIAPGIRWPILDWAKVHAAIRVANEEQAQALLTYQNTVSQALKDVEDALVRYEQEHARNRALHEAVAQSRLARQVTVQIHAQGLTDETATLQAEKAVYQAENALEQSDAALRTGLVGLYKALGGGWKAGQ